MIVFQLSCSFLQQRKQKLILILKPWECSAAWPSVPMVSHILLVVVASDQMEILCSFCIPTNDFVVL